MTKSELDALGVGDVVVHDLTERTWRVVSISLSRRVFFLELDGYDLELSATSRKMLSYFRTNNDVRTNNGPETLVGGGESKTT